MTQQTAIQITENAVELFRRYAKDAGNWGGTPLVGRGGNVEPVLGWTEDRGLLTHLKVEGLIRTFSDGGCQFLQFTRKGYLLAASMGITIRNWEPCWDD